MPKIVDHDEFREELIRKFFDLFARKGYENITMRELAKEFNLSTGTLYHYFPTKKSILEQIFKIASRHDISNALAQIKPEDSLSKRLKVFCDYVLKHESYYQDIVLLTIDHYRHQDENEAFVIINEADRYYGTKIAEALGLDSKYGFMVAIFLNGLVYHRLVFPDSVSFEEQSQLFQEMFTFYLENRDGKRGDE